MLNLKQVHDTDRFVPFIFELSSCPFSECLSHEFSLIASYFLGGSLLLRQIFVVLRHVGGREVRSLHDYRDF